MAGTDSVMNEDGVVNPRACAGKKKESYKHHSAVRQGCQVSRSCRVTQAFSVCLTLSRHSMVTAGVSREVPSREPVIECVHLE